jgi:NADH:ubiquinone oxidoreductase subunit C
MKNNLSRILTIYRDYLKKIFPQLIGYVINGDLFIKIPSNKIINFLSFLKKHTLGQYEVLSDICALDYP